MSESELAWRCESRGTSRVVAPLGRVDETTAGGFAERLGKEIDAAASGGERRLAIELAGIEYMSSRGLRALTLAQRKANEQAITIVLSQPNPVMREILAISRYDKVFQVFEQTDDAVAG